MQVFENTLLFAFKKSLHSTFATLLIYKEVINIVTIWDMFAIYFCDNLSY